VGSNQTSGALEVRFVVEFAQLVPSSSREQRVRSGQSRGSGETASRPIGTKQAKRRKLDHARDSRIVEAVSSIAESQRNDWKRASAGTTSL
jgi:hypothetical protein